MGMSGVKFFGTPFSERKVCADFQGAFYKKPLEARFGTAVPTYFDNIKNADFSAFFVVVISRGFRPKPRTKDFL